MSDPGPGRWRIRPTEIATIASALFLLATAAFVQDPADRAGLIVTFVLTLAYAVVWYHLLPAGTFGEARYAIAGSVVQAILVLMLLVTGGVRSPWFVFYLLPILATVFSYRPATTATIAAVGAAGLVATSVAGAPDLSDPDTREFLVVRLIGFCALATMTYTVTRAMRLQRAALERQGARLRELLSVAERDAMTDPLTGTHNRRALERDLARASSRAERYGEPYSVLLIDVDHLKTVNDEEGHAAGDEALRRVAEAATSSVRGYDIVARYGGDEFVVVLHGSGAAIARVTTDRIRRCAGDMLRSDPGLARMSVSVGAATWRKGASPDALLAQADTEMYDAKQKGRHAGR